METFIPSTITGYGYAHTLISVLAIAAGIWALIDGGRISAARFSGKVFYGVSLIGILTGITIFHHGGLGIGHGLSLLMLICLAVGIFSSVKSLWLAEIIASGLLFFLIWFFATTETLTRVPLDHPFAASPTDPSLVPVRGILLVILLVGLALQYRKFRRR